ncbi:MAG: molybdopterin-binding protein [Desulfurococcaceae archaeon]
MPYSASIIIVGSEVLKGITQDTNSHWLSKRVTELGFNVVRIIVVPDSFEDISWALRSALEVSDAVIVSGGLGFTADDITLEASARALGLKLILNEEALDMIRAKLSRGVSYQIKAAYLPEGSKPLKNHVGISPGVYLQVNNKDVFFLPGVPAEMKSIFESEISPILSCRAKYYTVTIDIVTKHRRESEVDSLISSLKQKYSEYYFKTHASTPVRLSIVISLPSRDALSDKVNALLGELKQVLDIESVDIK